MQWFQSDISLPKNYTVTTDTSVTVSYDGTILRQRFDSSIIYCYFDFHQDFLKPLLVQVHISSFSSISLIMFMRFYNGFALHILVYTCDHVHSKSQISYHCQSF